MKRYPVIMEPKNHKLNSEKRQMLLLTDGDIDQASARIRAIHYIPMFENEGFQVTHIPRVPVKSANKLLKLFFFPLAKRYLGIKRRIALLHGSWDIIFIQRSFIKEALLRKLKNRIPVIFDFDDAIYLQGKTKLNREKTGIMVRYADDIIISSDFLNEFCRLFNRNGFVIPTPVETGRIKPEKTDPREVPTIGWIGSPWTTVYLRVVERSLQKLNEKVSFNFLTVGAHQNFQIEGINHISGKWSFKEENSFINQMDIGIMPLPDDEFTRAKGGYKLYLYMAGGIPCVASPVGVNNSIIRNGENGFLAANEDEWVDALTKLISDKQLRERLGQTGRSDALKYYDRDVCFEKLIGRVNRLVRSL
jgi:glycosyltransferase involved in cell wall biosynthesis